MKKLVHILTIIACIISPTVMADSMNDDELDSAYIAGFLAGAELTDSVIMKRFDDYTENDEPSDFLKRAFKTRLGPRPVTVQATYYAGFCLPEDTSEKVIIETILEEVRNADSSPNLEKSSAVFLALRNIYPCS